MIEKRTTLKALLVGVNDYSRYPLRGCVNDVNDMINFLSEDCREQNIAFDPVVLLNEEATRPNIIHYFLTHLGKSLKGDQLLFYFSGHGTRRLAPSQFWHNSPNHFFESIVCYNQKDEDICDIADKELSFLIYHVMQHCSTPIVMIIDCCFSGEITRGEEAHARRLDNYKPKREWTTFLGAPSYSISDEAVVAPTGRHLRFSACRNDEIAKEKNIGGVFRGVFTYSLLQAIRASNRFRSWYDIERATQKLVLNQSNDQHPQLRATHSQDKRLIFFKSIKKSLNNNGIVYYNKQVQDGRPRGWIMDIGYLSGLTQASLQSATQVWLYKDDFSTPQELNLHHNFIKVTINGVFSDFVTVDVPEEIPKDIYYEATFDRNPYDLMRVAFSLDSDQEGIHYFMLDYHSAPSKYIQLTTSIERVSCIVKAKANQYTIEASKAKNYMFRRFLGYNTRTVTTLFQALETIAQWKRVKELQNHRTSLGTNDLELTFHTASQLRSSQKIIKREVPHFLSVPQVLQLTDRQVGRKGFFLKIKNPKQSKQTIWCSVLYLGADYSISNDLMPMQKLDPGEEKTVEYYNKLECRFQSFIPMYLEPIYLNHGICEVEEHFKIIISTHEFSTYPFVQEGLLYDADTVPYRSEKRKEEEIVVNDKDWISIDFYLILKKQ
ncbi:MAG: caspase family protein [Bacteroidota bacterium]